MTNHDAPDCRNIRGELSAWLDNEAGDPGRIEAHLHECPACARYAGELEAVSSALKNLPAPAVDDFFAAQVAERIRRTESARRRRRAVAGVLAVAASVAIVAAALISQLQPAPGQFGLAETDILHGLENGEAWMVAEILHGATPELWDYGFPVPRNLPETSEDELVMSLAESAWFLQAADAWEAQADLDQLVLALDDAEKIEFKRLLDLYKESIEI